MKVSIPSVDDDDAIGQSVLEKPSTGLAPDLKAFVVIVDALSALDEEKRWAVLRAAEAYFQKLDRRGRNDD